jgi:hypothetical protein
VTLGINGVGLDADRTRDKLAETLGEIERRLTPAHIRSRVMTTVRDRPVPFIAAAASVVGAVVGIVVLVALRSARG